MTVTSADFAQFYKQQKEAIYKEKKSEQYGLTKTERLKLRRLLGYSGDENSPKKSVEFAGAFTRQALKLNGEDDDNNNINNSDNGEKNDGGNGEKNGEKNVGNRGKNEGKNEGNNGEKNEDKGPSDGRKMGDVPRLFTEVKK